MICSKNLDALMRFLTRVVVRLQSVRRWQMYCC